MFLLTIISGSSNTGPIDGSNQLFETENKIQSLELLLKNSAEQEQYSKAAQITSAMYRTMELQELLTNLYVGRQSLFSVDGVDNNNLDAVTEALNVAKRNEALLRNATGMLAEGSLVSMSFAKKMNELVSNRITLLQGVEKYLTQSSQQFYNMIQSAYPIAPSSFYFEDPNLVAVRIELQRLEDYKKGIDENEAYWNKIAGNNQTVDNSNETSTPKPAVNNTSEAIKMLAAGTDMKISNLKDIFDFVSERDSVENLESREASIKQEIKSQLGRLDSLISNSPTFSTDRQRGSDKVAELMAMLNSVIQEKSRSSLMEQIGNSIKEAISTQSTYQGIYSSYS